MLPISVVIPAYNAEEFIRETIESVLNQTFIDYELIIADDMSDDQTKDIILSYNDLRIRYVLCNHDFIGTRNKALQMARGKYIAQLDHDDIMVPDRLRIQYDFMETHSEIAACGGFLKCFGKLDEIWRGAFGADDLLLHCIVETPILNPTGFIRREILTKHKIRHRRGYSFAEDYKFWTEIAKVGKLAVIPKVLVHYRISDKQASVIHSVRMHEATLKIQNEMINYFLSKLNTDSKLGKIVSSKFLPSLEKIIHQGFFSKDVYFAFMHELIRGLKLKGEIKL